MDHCFYKNIKQHSWKKKNATVFPSEFSLKWENKKFIDYLYYEHTLFQIWNVKALKYANTTLILITILIRATNLTF